MAITYGFYNSLNHDRVYNAEQMSAIFDGVIRDGVFASIGDTLMTIAGTGMQVIVKSGRAWFDHTWTLNDAPLALDIAAADVSLTRIDSVILEVNSEIGSRENTIKILQGTPSANPAPPELADTLTLHQHALANINVGPNATSITASDITILVGQSSCPFATSVLESVAIDDLFNKWDSDFNAWFDNLKTQLSGDVAANLLNEINKVNERVDDVEDRLELIMKNKAMVRVTLKTQNGNLLPGVLIDGLSATDTGGNVITNSQGVAEGFVDEGTITISISNYADIEDYTETHEVYKGYIYEYEWTVTVHNFQWYESSIQRRLSENVSRLDASVGGGGGGGGWLSTSIGYGMSGGGGGYAAMQENLPFTPHELFSIIVGAGGTYCQAGGASSILSLNANGGDGASSTAVTSTTAGNGQGGAGSGHSNDTNGGAGTAGVGSIYSSFTEIREGYGGGGGGGVYCNASDSDHVKRYGGAGGGYGGKAGDTDPADRCTASENGVDTYGGGGGGSSCWRAYASDSVYMVDAGTGGNGIASIRMHLKVS